MADKKHVSIVICGHVDSGKSTTTGRLIFELGGIPEREMDKLRAEADALGKSSFAFAFYMDRQKEERARGVTIACTTKEFYTASYHYTIIDAPGHRDFIKNMITGASQADVAMLMIPADGNFVTAIQKGNSKENQVQGQSRQHARLINLLGVKQLIIGINKMDSDSAKYSKERYDEIQREVSDMLIRVGWPKGQILKGVPFIPISGWRGDNLLKKSENMAWWDGVEVVVKGEKAPLKIVTVLDALEKMVKIPARPLDKNLRVPISGIYKIKGVGDVLTGRVEQGSVKPGQEVVFLPTHTDANPCIGKVFSVEMHHKAVELAGPGDNVGMNIKNLSKSNMPHNGDVMVLKTDTTLRPAKKIVTAVQVLEHPGELKNGYTPVGFVRTGRAPIRMTKIMWKIGKETGGEKMENPPHLKAGDMAEVIFEPQLPFVADAFENCEGLSRLAVMEGNGVIMLGKIMSIE
jgi:elongation factor 1-alpha